MCGILYFFGSSASKRLRKSLNRLQHRGPDDQGEWHDDNMALGFTRLTINGNKRSGHQPNTHADLIGAINGEIYNHKSLAQKYGLALSTCDTNVILQLFALSGPRFIDDLDGFYAGTILRPATQEVFCLRDHMGKKPLFVGRSQGELFISSELKAVDQIDWFKPLPRGVSKVDLETGQVTLIAAHRPIKPKENINILLEDAVRKRMPRSGQPIGFFLSGGLDSSLIAAFVSRLRDDAIYFTLGDPAEPDQQALRMVVAALNLKKVRHISLPSPKHIPELVRSIVYATESYNPSIVSNGIATFLLAQAASKAGIKVVLTGEGADELLGGYHLFREEDPWREIRDQLINDMHFTELRRLDLSCMAHGVEARCPFLDRAVRGFSDLLDYSEMYDGEENKVSLRRSFKGVLPTAVLHRQKTSLDVGSGIRGMVVRYLRRRGKSEREELLELWRQRFTYDALAPYFHSYPVFDDVIDRRGESHS